MINNAYIPLQTLTWSDKLVTYTQVITRVQILLNHNLMGFNQLDSIKVFAFCLSTILLWAILHMYIRLYYVHATYDS